jgi:hypothetical protein
MGRLKTNSQRVFRELLKKHNEPHCRIPGVSASAANRLYHGYRTTSPKVIDAIAKHFGDDGKELVRAWIEDKACELSCLGPSKWKLLVVIE